jgi:adenylate cyclase
MVEIVERTFARDAKYTRAELAEKAGVREEDLTVTRAAFGLPVPADRVYDDKDVEITANLRALLDAGAPVEAVVELNRVIGRAMAQVAATSRALVLQTLGDDDPAAADARLAELVPGLAPLMEPVLGFAYAEHVRRLVRSELVAGTDLGARPVAIAFADLVGFTRLGEEVPPEDLGRVAARLEQLAAEHVEPPVQVVKTIGDAVMLVAPTPAPLVDTVLALVAVEADDLPQLRAGVACGPALERAGDWYGRPVNLASRVTDVARPGSVVATTEVREAASGDVEWSSLRPRKLKGIGEVRLHRARRGDGDRSSG